jgi:hypothetical protein
MTYRDPAQYERARRTIRNYLSDGEWHASREIHERLANDVPKDWLFGAIKKDLLIEHRQMKGRFYWRLAPRATASRLNRRSKPAQPGQL